MTFDLIYNEGGRGKITVVTGTAQDLENDCVDDGRGG